MEPQETAERAAEQISLGTDGEVAMTTHQLAAALLALPDTVLSPLRQQGGPQAWSDQLHPEVSVQVGIRSW